MKLFLLYIRSKYKGIVLIIVLYLLLFVTFYLADLPLYAVWYPVVLHLCISSLFFLVNFIRIKNRHLYLASLAADDPQLLERLPQTYDISLQDHQEIIRKLMIDKQDKEQEGFLKYRDMVDYYTVWAHQIKTPIQSMRLGLENSDFYDSGRYLRELARIERYVNMVMTYLRLSEGSTDYVFKEYDLDDIIKKTIRQYSGDFISKRLCLNYEPLTKKVLTDDKWLSFVIGQVLSNAIKYTDKGAVTISLEEGDILCIRDTGMGIAAEDLPRIFENGYTGFNGRADKRASGIGLYLCSRICKNLGHSINASSVVGEGTTIRIGLGRASLEIF